MKAGPFNLAASGRWLFWGAVAFTLVMALAPVPPMRVTIWDKAQHMLAFAVLSVLGAIAYPRLGLVQLALRLSLFGALIELAQALPFIRRDSDPLDWVADTLACALVAGVLFWWSRPRR